jgi:hypothetical protein
LRAVVIFALAVLVALCARRWIEAPVLGCERASGPAELIVRPPASPRRRPAQSP